MSFIFLSQLKGNRLRVLIFSSLNTSWKCKMLPSNVRVTHEYVYTYLMLIISKVYINCRLYHYECMHTKLTSEQNDARVQCLNDNNTYTSERDQFIETHTLPLEWLKLSSKGSQKILFFQVHFSTMYICPK